MAKNKKKVGSPEFSWAHFIALGLLTRPEGRILTKERDTLSPEVQKAVTDLVNRGYARWDETIFQTMPGYSLTELGERYAKQIGNYASSMVKQTIEEDLPPI